MPHSFVNAEGLKRSPCILRQYMATWSPVLTTMISKYIGVCQEKIAWFEALRAAQVLLASLNSTSAQYKTDCPHTIPPKSGCWPLTILGTRFFKASTGLPKSSDDPFGSKKFFLTSESQVEKDELACRASHRPLSVCYMCTERAQKMRNYMSKQCGC